MGRGLSAQQRQILDLAGRYGGTTLPEILHEVWGLPYREKLTRGFSFSPPAIGEDRYQAAYQAAKKAVHRLRSRGLLSGRAWGQLGQNARLVRTEPKPKEPTVRYREIMGDNCIIYEEIVDGG